MTLLNKYKKDSYSFLIDATEKQIVKLINDANKQYYNFDNPIMTDEEYDILKEELEVRNPEHKLLKTVGDTHSKDKAKLPFFMGSMDKIKPGTDLISKWSVKYKGPYVLSDKLDGSSGLLVFNKENVKLFTRGNGKVGTDISSMTNGINGIPSIKTDIVVRGELIIQKKHFNKFKDTYSNLRAMINGLVGKKKVNSEELQLIDFVCYEVIEPELKPYDQMKMLKKLGFYTVENIISKNIDEEYLSSYFKSRKENSKYDIDGIIITNNEIYKRTDSNPKHSFAFKELLEDQIAETTITDVEWRLSKDGLIKPRVHLKPTIISGIKIMHVTGHNAKYIVDNGIGKGAIIKLTRAGEVIPYILEVIKKTKPSEPKISFKWNSTNVDYIINEDEMNEENEYDILVRNLIYFFKKMEIKFVDESIIKKMIDIGLDSIHKILNASIDDFLKIENFKEKMATKVHTNIQNAIKEVNLSQLMSASNLFGHGLGSKKLQLIIENFPEILTMKINKKDLIEKIIEIDGFDTKSATQFANNLNSFKKFISNNKNIKIKIKINKIKTNGDFKDIKLVFTGFRNKELEKLIVSEGGEVVNTVSKNTTYLITNDKDSTSSKITKAKELNIKILTPKELIKKFNITSIDI